MRFTVFTPTFNRAHTLPRLHASLRRQTYTDFEWLVVDDGSTDGTARWLSQMMATNQGFPVRVITRQNGGKHRAINTGLAEAAGELFFIVDSDDWLPDGALATVDAVEQTIPPEQRSRFAGVCGLRGTADGRRRGTTFEGQHLDITTLQRGQFGIRGDKAEVVYTAILRAYPFPEFPGERFMPEGVIWDRIAHDGLKFRFFNEIVYSSEYLAGGLTDRYRQLLHDNPRGHGLYISQNSAYAGYPARQAIGRLLAFHDAHRGDLSSAEIASNLGLHPVKLLMWRSMRSVMRGVRGNRGESSAAPIEAREAIQGAATVSSEPPDASAAAPVEGTLVSVIIPVYNTVEYLRECVDSVLRQTLQRLEVILVDDGSTDGSGALCDNYALRDPRVRVVHQPNLGLSDARNTGLRNANAPWVMFLDSDDWLAPACLEVLHELVHKADAQVALCGTMRATDPAKSRAPTFDGTIHILTGDDFLRNPTAHEPVHPVSACAKLIDRTLLAGLWFPSRRLHEDVYTTHVFLHRAERIGINRSTLHYYRQRSGSITAGVTSWRSAADKARAHLTRATDLQAFGLTEVASLEFHRGLAWHLRTVAAAPPTSEVASELKQQRALVLRRQAPRMAPATRLLVWAYGLAPRPVARIAASAWRRSGGTHEIEGEARRT